MLRVMAIVHQRPSITRHNTVLTAIFWEIQVSLNVSNLDFTGAKDDGGMVKTGAIRAAKLQ